MTKICPQCHKALDRKDVNYRKKKFCSVACMGKSYHSTPEEFWEKVDKGPHPKGCWLYKGYKQKFGHGWLGRLGLAHRYAWSLVNGPVAKGECILHRCDVPACVNPEHLYKGNRYDNARDMYDRRRANTKIKPEQVIAIRAAFQGVTGRSAIGKLQRELAAKYSLVPAWIWAIRTGRKWKSVGPEQFGDEERR